MQYRPMETTGALNECSESTCGPRSNGWEPLLNPVSLFKSYRRMVSQSFPSIRLAVTDTAFQMRLANEAGMREAQAMSPKMTAKPVLIPLQTLSDVPKQPKASNPQGGFSISKIDLKRTRKSL